jgi:Papain-like cysteine protease AvrRpt2
MPQKLSFIMQSQQQTEWCWAAVSASVAGFFNSLGPAGTPWKQCEVANKVRNDTTCCQNGASSNCNHDDLLDSALTVVGHLVGPVAANPLLFPGVENEINLNRPVALRIGWYSGGGHFVAIDGYDDTGGVQIVDVEDPWYGPSTYDYTQFCTGYQSGAGQWTHTYPVA